MKAKPTLTVLLFILIAGFLGTVVADEKNTLTYDYQVNLNDIVRERYEVQLACSAFAADTLIFHFPWIIPGTYMEANYGKFIKKLKVYDREGNPIKTKRQGKNTYIITPANNIGSITYQVGATWKSRSMKVIWPMAGTGIVEDRAFVINAGGVFGYFEGQELAGVEMTFTYPDHLYPMSVLDHQSLDEGKVYITSSDYHELVDSPIMFAYPDTSSFMVHDTEVLVGFAHENDDTRRAEELKAALMPSMDAISSYIDSLPCDEYAYLVYYYDAEALGKILSNPRFALIKGLWYFIRHGMPMGGALEHQKSSFYYLPDPGGMYTEYIGNTIEDIAIHEFMHILTPLNLHSQYIDDWDYNDPIMSKHLWLYEGITEYMSKIIQVNGDLTSPKEFILDDMQGKIRRGERFPLADMSFTTMSSNVLDEPYSDEFLQVYQRGAVMGMLLDIEIIRLTKGRMRLIDVMLELASEYGPSRPMDEEQIFDLFTDRSHPEIRDFFTRYVEGQEPLPYTEILDHVGVIYRPDTTLMRPRHPIQDLKVAESNFSMGPKRTLAKVGKNLPLDLRKGDQLDADFYFNQYFDDLGQPKLEGMLVALDVIRDGEMITIQDTVTYLEKDRQHYMEIQSEMSDSQRLYFDIWLGFQERRAD